MTPHEVLIWNAAIDAALSVHYKGIGAIQALHVSAPIVINHEPQTTEVALETSRDND
ncbi:MAG: hypothetical protein ACRCYS_07360 [Beijerinckiaceae bacterium]